VLNAYIKYQHCKKKKTKNLTTLSLFFLEIQPHHPHGFFIIDYDLVTTINSNFIFLIVKSSFAVSYFLYLTLQNCSFHHHLFKILTKCFQTQKTAYHKRKNAVQMQ
jgi:hypothetical protein